MQIIRHASHEEVIWYERSFRWRDDPNAGFGFGCDAEGNVDTSQMHPAGIENLQKCLDGTHDVIDQGVQTYTKWVKHPAVGRCVCGAEVVLDGFTCPCYKCGRDYNWAGQELAPRECWGEETGEDPADISRL